MTKHFITPAICIVNMSLEPIFQCNVVLLGFKHMLTKISHMFSWNLPLLTRADKAQTMASSEHNRLSLQLQTVKTVARDGRAAHKLEKLGPQPSSFKLEAYTQK